MGIYRDRILGSDAKAQLEAAFCLRKLLSREKSPPTEHFLRLGVLRRVVDLMKHTQDARMQFECAWILTNIASSDHTKLVVDAGALPVLCVLLRSSNVDVREQCIWCLGNIAGDGYMLRDAVLRTEGAVTNVILNIKNPMKQSMQRNAVWALSNLARFKPAPNVQAIKPAALVFSQLVQTTRDREVLVDSCWGLQYVSDAHPELVDVIARSNVLPRLVSLLGEGVKAYGTPIMRCIGNIVGGDDEHTDLAIRAGVLPALAKQLQNASRNQRREATWALSNVAAGSKTQINELVHTPGLIHQLLDTMTHDDDMVQNEACWAVCNVAASGTDDHRLVLAKEGAIRCLCQMLAKRHNKILHIAVGGLSSLLRLGKEREAAGLSPAFDELYAEFEEAQGVEKMEELQDLDDAELVAKVDAFADEFLDVEGEGEDAADENFGATEADGQAFSFGITSGASAAASMKPPLAGATDGWGSFGAAAADKSSGTAAGQPLGATGAAAGGWADFGTTAWS